MDKELKEIKYLKDIDVSYVLDNLTQVISREYIIEIGKGLMKDKIPFALIIVDLDNFKQINDSFGHLVGDFILQNACVQIRTLLQKAAYVGRYGGDEILILVPNITTYDEAHIFLEKLYATGVVFRKYYNNGNREIYLTATAGCSIFPNDANDFEELFNKADKALYRGKTKGRNCYIIYVESKHANIIIHEKIHGSVIEKFKAVKRVFEIYHTKRDKLKHLVDFLYSEMHCSAVYFLFPDKTYISNFYSSEKTTHLIIEPHLELLLNGDSVFYDTPLTKYKANDVLLSDYVESHSIQSLLIVKVKLGKYFYGYLIISEASIKRVWQEIEVAITMYAASLLELEYKDYE